MHFRVARRARVVMRVVLSGAYSALFFFQVAVLFVLRFSPRRVSHSCDECVDSQRPNPPNPGSALQGESKQSKVFDRERTSPIRERTNSSMLSEVGIHTVAYRAIL